MRQFITLLNQPLEHYKLIILVIAVAFIFVPNVVDPNDYELNVEPLVMLNAVYDNPAYVYPPQALTLMSPFLLVNEAIIRVLTVLMVAWYGYSRMWTLMSFLVAVLNPIFVFAMLFANLDLFIVLLPVLLFKRAPIWGQALLLSVLMLKPQMGVLVALYFVVQYKAWKAAFLGAAFTLAHFIIPDPSGMPIGLGWIDNIINPTDYNRGAWMMNAAGFRWVIFITLPLAYYVSRQSWTEDKTIASLLIIALTLSPYASVQSVLVPIVILINPLLTIVHWGMVLASMSGIVWYFFTALVFSAGVAMLQERYGIFEPNIQNDGR